MSKINAVRIINLNYNHNMIRVDDETWQFNGESTLLSLRNGGGKSVLVQMMSAPFVHKNYLGSKERPFSSYFTTNQPTFILVEWMLDDHAGYVLTGMMVRQHQAEEDDNGEALDITNIIFEYQTPNANDIHHIPVIVEEANRKKLKSYKACLEMFEQYRNDAGMQFFVYDMNQPAQARSYFHKLEEYRVYYKEWESIIKKINKRESGLSELFADAKGERALVEKWFLPAVETKLNKTEDTMKQFRKLMQQYVNQYCENREKLAKREQILQFLEACSELMLTAEESVQTLQKKQQLENHIAHFLHDLELEAQAKEQALYVSTAQLQKLEQDIRMVRYNQYSWEHYQIEEERQQQEQLHQQLTEQEQKLQQSIVEVERQLHVQECARRYDLWKEDSRAVQQIENQIELLKQDEKSIQPEREQIGYTLRCHYERELEHQVEQLGQLEQRLLQLNEQMGQQEQEKKQQQEHYTRKTEKLAGLKERIRQYDQEEQRFQRRHQQQLARNLLGEYEPGFLEHLLQEQEQQIKALGQQMHQLASQKEEEKQNIHRLKREKEETTEKKAAANEKLQWLKEKVERFKQELELRRTLAEHVGVSQEQVLEKDVLLDAFQKRLDMLQQELRVLQNQSDAAAVAYRRMQHGQVLELSPALKEGMDMQGIRYSFGMEWLQKNGYSEQQNQALVTDNPFIPYSLVMSQKELQRLQHSGLMLYTEAPIPIICREKLEEKLECNGPICILQEQLAFYILFDQRLLDGAALAQLLAEQQEKRTQIQTQIANKEEARQFYQQKADLVKAQQVDRVVYEQTEREQIAQLELIAEAETRWNQLSDEIETLEKRQEQLEQQIRAIERKQQENKRYEQDLTELKQAYVTYQENRRQAATMQKELDMLKQALETLEAQLLEAREQQTSWKDEQRESRIQVKQTEQALQRFQTYSERPVLQQDINDLLSRYDAIVKQSSAKQQELEEQLQAANSRYARTQDDLLNYSKQCQLVQDDYAAVTYDLYTVKELQQKQKTLQVQKDTSQQKKQDCAIKLAELKKEQEYLLRDLKETLGYSAPRPRAEVIPVDFEQALAEKRYQQELQSQEQKKLQERLQLVQEQMGYLEEFRIFPISAPWEDRPVVSRMDKAALSRIRGELKRDYNKIGEQQRDIRERLYRQTDEISRRTSYQQDDFFGKPLATLLSLTEVPGDYLSQLSATQEAYRIMLDKLAADIALLEREKQSILESFLDYLQDVYRQLREIDRNATIQVRDRALKMLRISQPPWDTYEELYTTRMHQYLDEITEQCMHLLDQNQNVEDLLSARITTIMLYDAVIGVQNIEIRLYKIEAQQEYQISWSDVAQNSGGEGFLSAFIVLSSLLSFMRRDESDVFLEREEGKVLLMDNPFAQTNAAHLLKPMMDMARRTNTQLICLSGLGGDSIYSRFENIYVLTLVASGLSRGTEYLRGEHLRGSEAETMLSAHIETEDMEQIVLF